MADVVVITPEPGSASAACEMFARACEDAPLVVLSGYGDERGFFHRGNAPCVDTGVKDGPCLPAPALVERADMSNVRVFSTAGGLSALLPFENAGFDAHGTG
jgi:hypothetical protein